MGQGAEYWSQIATIVGGISALISLPVIAWQVYRTSKLAEADFLLKLEGLCQTYNDVALQISRDPAWSPTQDGQQLERFQRVRDYMGFFEYCELLIQNGAVREGVVLRMFGYKIDQLLQNEGIMAATVRHAEFGKYWKLFASISARAKRQKS